MKRIVRTPSFVPAIVLAIAFLFTFAFAVSGVADAEDTFSADLHSEISLGHMSDIHYFPLENCYTQITADDYYDSDFYNSMTGDTKLVLESGTILNANVRRFIAEAQTGAAPHYLFATGDLCKNGERLALVDVANALRFLQNEVRKVAGYENFQVFVITGNHDLYNGSGALYSHIDGSGHLAETVTAAQFALIFAGLGFPNASLDGNLPDGGKGIALTDIYGEDYWATSYTGGYVASNNAGNLTLSYFSDAFGQSEWYYALGSGHNTLSYRVEIADNPDYVFFLLDGTDREAAESLVPVRINRTQYEVLKNDPEETFYTTDAEGNVALDALDEEGVEAAFAAGQPVFADSKLNHLTGGRITEEVFNWIDSYTLAPKNVGKTYVAAYHFNALPHFEQEDDILKDFVFYNWEYTTLRFLEAGIRYGLGGHMHASDVAYYTDAAGRTFYELETGSSVSYNSPIRFIDITRYTLDDGATGEKFTSSIHILDGLKETASTNITAAAPWNDAAYQTAYAAYAASPTAKNWQAVVDANPDYFAYTLHYDRMSVLSYDDYITEEIYGILVERIVDHFVNRRTIDDLDLVGVVTGALEGNAFFGEYANTLGKIVGYLVDTVLEDLYGEEGYPYNGKTYDNAVDYLKAVVQTLLDLKFGQEGKELTLSEMASFIMMAHTAGMEPTTEEVFGAELPAISGTASEKTPYDKVYRAQFIAALRDFSDFCDRGDLAKTLLDTLLDPLYRDDNSLIKTLLSYRFDLTKAGLTYAEESKLDEIFDLIETVLNMYTDTNIELQITKDNIVLESFLPVLFPVLQGLLTDSLGLSIEGDNLYDAVDTLLEDYLTDSFYVGLSGIANNIVIAFATDDERDFNDIFARGTPFTLVPHEGYAAGYAELACGQLTYVSDQPVAIEFNEPTQENGRLPSALTANFSTEAGKGGSEFKLSFYTAENIGAEVVLYDGEGNEISTLRLTTDDMDASKDKDFRTTRVNNDSIIINGETRAQYIPLIDLGLLCIQHTEVTYEVTDADGKVVEEKEYTYLERDNAPGNSVVYKNRFIVTFYGLEPGETYAYEVRGVYGSGDDAITFGLAENLGEDYFTFSTAPDESVTDFDFIAIADMQGMIEAMYKQTAETIDTLTQTAGEYSFVLNAGDMADNGKNFYQWQWALNHNVKFFANTSTFTAAGNHENGSGAISKFYAYDTPENVAQNEESGLFYSFDYASAHIIVLNTNDTSSEEGLNNDQYRWLRDELIANRDAKWTFVLMHKSLYSAGSHAEDGEIVAMRGQLPKIFATYGVDLVFAGHDHTYTVTKFLDKDAYVADKKYIDDNTVDAAGTGTSYITLGTIGTKYYTYEDSAALDGRINKRLSIMQTLDSPTFVKVSVRGDELTYTGYQVLADGSLKEILNDVDDPDPVKPAETEPVAPEEPDDNLYVKIFVPIAVVIVVAGAVVGIVLGLRAKNKKKAQAKAKKKPENKAVKK